MRGKGTHRFFITLVMSCLLSVVPLISYAADLTISDIVTTNGNWTLIGAMTATSFSGDGTGLSNVTASGLLCTGCVSPSQLDFTPGTITGVSVSGDSGLAGGGSSGNVSLSVNFAGTGSASTAARSDHTHGTMYYQRIGKVTVVAQSGGDYADPVTAMSDVSIAAWCGTPSASNTCLLKIMPGVYDIGASMVNMKSYVDIEGSGENVTVIQGNVDGSSGAVLNGADNAELRFLTVKNKGGGAYAVAIGNTSASPKLTNVTAYASGGTSSTFGIGNDTSSPVMTNVTVTVSGVTHNYGVQNMGGSPVMINVTVTASGGTTNWGVDNEGSSPTMTNVNVTASGGTSSRGVNNEISSPIMTNVAVTASGGTTSNRGIHNYISSPTMTNVTVTASGGTTSWGIYNQSSSGTVKINHSVIAGTTNTINNGSGVTTLVSNTQLDGGAVSTAGPLTCVGAYDTNYVQLGTDCLPVP